MIEYDVNVDRLAVDRPLVRKDFHAIDELHDPVRLITDQLGERTVFVASRLLQKLRRAANARQWILDLMRQHGCQRNHRAGGATMGELAIHLVCDRPLLEHDDNVLGVFRQRRDVEVDQALAGIAWRCQIDLVFVDCRSALPHLLDQGQERRAEWHELAQQVPAQHGRRRLEELLCRNICVGNLAVRGYHDHRMRQCVQHRVRRCIHHRSNRLRTRHAAALQAKSSNASAR